MKKIVRILLVAGVIGAVVVVGMRVVASRKAQQATSQSAPTLNEVLEFAASDSLEVQPKALQLGLPISGSLRAVRTAVIKARVAVDEDVDAGTVLALKAALTGTFRRRFRVLIDGLFWIDPTAGIPTFSLTDAELGFDGALR